MYVCMCVCTHTRSSIRRVRVGRHGGLYASSFFSRYESTMCVPRNPPRSIDRIVFRHRALLPTTQWIGSATRANGQTRTVVFSDRASAPVSDVVLFSFVVVIVIVRFVSVVVPVVLTNRSVSFFSCTSSRHHRSDGESSHESERTKY